MTTQQRWNAAVALSFVLERDWPAGTRQTGLALWLDWADRLSDLGRGGDAAEARQIAHVARLRLVARGTLS
jgi:hypothetical protein